MKILDETADGIILQNLIQRWNSEVYDDGHKPTVFEYLLRESIFRLIDSLRRKELEAHLVPNQTEHW